METKRLLIRKFTSNDGEDLKEYAIYKVSTGYDAWEKWPTDSDGCREVAEFFAASDKYWAVCRKSDGKMIGFISFNTINEEKHLDLGHGFTLAYNQDGEDVEALDIMIQHAFDSLDIVAVDAHNAMEWKEQIAPLYELGFYEIADRMQMTKEEWHKRKFNKRRLTMKIALLIVDMQEVFLQNQKETLNAAVACEHINHVADLLRSKNHCVIHVQDIEGADHHNSELLHIIPEIEVKETDIRITKKESNAFWNTDLEQILLKEQVGLVIVAGFAAEHCVLFTYNGAKERGFKTVILQNGILSTNSDVIAITCRDRNIVSYPVIEFIVS